MQICAVLSVAAGSLRGLGSTPEETVNMELWEIIQKHYPEEYRLRVSEQQSEEIIDDSQPVHLLSQPGELRREYEEERSKVEAERQAIQEEENKASEKYIRRLLGEEEEEEKRQAEKRHRDGRTTEK